MHISECVLRWRKKEKKIKMEAAASKSAIGGTDATASLEATEQSGDVGRSVGVLQRRQRTAQVDAAKEKKKKKKKKKPAIGSSSNQRFTGATRCGGGSIGRRR